MPFRGYGHVTQSTNMRVTSKQNGCDRVKSDKYLRVCPFDNTYYQEDHCFMCGIIGFAGREQAAPILLDGLERMEYRGYDLSLIHI